MTEGESQEKLEIMTKELEERRVIQEELNQTIRPFKLGFTQQLDGKK